MKTARIVILTRTSLEQLEELNIVYSKYKGADIAAEIETAFKRDPWPAYNRELEFDKATGQKKWTVTSENPEIMSRFVAWLDSSHVTYKTTVPMKLIEQTIDSAWTKAGGGYEPQSDFRKALTSLEAWGVPAAKQFSKKNAQFLAKSTDIAALEEKLVMIRTIQLAEQDGFRPQSDGGAFRAALQHLRIITADKHIRTVRGCATISPEGVALLGAILQTITPARAPSSAQPPHALPSGLPSGGAVPVAIMAPGNPADAPYTVPVAIVAPNSPRNPADATLAIAYPATHRHHASAPGTTHPQSWMHPDTSAPGTTHPQSWMHLDAGRYGDTTSGSSAEKDAAAAWQPPHASAPPAPVQEFIDIVESLSKEAWTWRPAMENTGLHLHSKPIYLGIESRGAKAIWFHTSAHRQVKICLNESNVPQSAWQKQPSPDKANLDTVLGTLRIFLNSYRATHTTPVPPATHWPHTSAPGTTHSQSWTHPGGGGYGDTTSESSSFEEDAFAPPAASAPPAPTPSAPPAPAAFAPPAAFTPPAASAAPASLGDKIRALQTEMISLTLAVVSKEETKELFLSLEKNYADLITQLQKATSGGLDDELDHTLRTQEAVLKKGIIRVVDSLHTEAKKPLDGERSLKLTNWGHRLVLPTPSAPTLPWQVSEASAPLQMSAATTTGKYGAQYPGASSYSDPTDSSSSEVDGDDHVPNFEDLALRFKEYGHGKEAEAAPTKHAAAAPTPAQDSSVKIEALRAEMKAAGNAGRFQDAIKLKKIVGLCTKMKAAASAGRFQDAHKLKKEVQKLTQQFNASKQAKASNSASALWERQQPVRDAYPKPVATYPFSETFKHSS